MFYWFIYIYIYNNITLYYCVRFRHLPATRRRRRGSYNINIAVWPICDDGGGREKLAAK